jgi:hypothetical protein
MEKWIGFSVMVVMTLSLSGCLGGGSESEEKFDKAGALEFSLKVVKTYFDNDMDEFVSYLDDEVYSLEGEGPIAKKDAEDILREDDYVADEDYPTHTYQEYLDTYDPKVLDSKEVTTEHSELIGEMKALGWDYGSDDYLFMGFETKPGKEEFLWDDPLVFVVTCEDGKWAFKAFGS